MLGKGQLWAAALIACGKNGFNTFLISPPNSKRGTLAGYHQSWFKTARHRSNCPAHDNYIPGLFSISTRCLPLLRHAPSFLSRRGVLYWLGPAEARGWFRPSAKPELIVIQSGS